MYYVTVRDILKLDIASEWSVAAGAEGLGKTVSWVYICQENEIAPWVQGRELMFLYGSGVKCDVPDLVRMVEICAERQLSGIVVLIGHFFHELPPEMLAAADKYSVPLLTMPATIPISEATKAIAYLLLSDNRYARRGGDTLRDIIYGYDEDERSHFNAIERAGYKMRANSFVAVLRSWDNSLSEYRDIQQIITDVCEELYTPVVYAQKNRVVALTGVDGDSPDTLLLERGRALLEHLGSAYDLNNVYFALGSRISEKNSIKSSYRDAVNTVKAVGAFSESAKCVKYDEVPAILKLLFRTDNTDFIRECCDSELRGLIDYDQKHGTPLVGTLIRYADENYNVSRAAEKLYIHRNTMNNRLRLIFDILGGDFSDSVRRFAVENALYCYRYINMQSEHR